MPGGSAPAARVRANERPSVVAGPASPTAPRATDLLTVERLIRRFGGITAVDDLSFTIRQHEKLAVIGPNGAGKSTLLKMIAGQDRPTSGTIELAGHGPIQGRSARSLARAGVALARQVPRPLPSISVRQNIEVGLRAGAARRSGREQDRLAEILDLTALADKAKRPAGSLPLLDLKRLEMARALATEPRLLLLDEVSAGLNESELDEAIALIARLHAAGSTLLIVEHVQKVVHELADRVLVLNFGALLTSGTPAQVTADERVQQIYLGAGPADRRQEPPRSRPGPGRTDAGLRVTDLSVQRGMHRALEKVDLVVEAGSITTVLGPNGAGKSTLAETISGMLPVRSGTLHWQGVDITRVPAHRRPALRIAHCQEGRRLFPGLTVLENLQLGAYGVRAAERRTRLDRVFSTFPVLAERRGQLGTTMSGGQQQMLAIARALMASPLLLVLDEVTLGLSPKVADEIYLALQDAASSGTGLLLIEQDVDRSLRLADHAVVLTHGRVVYDGAPAGLTQEHLIAAYLGGTNATAPVDPDRPGQKELP